MIRTVFPSHARRALAKTVGRRTAALIAIFMALSTYAVTGVNRNLASTPLAGATFAGVTLRTPAAWPLYDLSSDPKRCVTYDAHAVFVGHQGSDPVCPARLRGKTETVQLELLDAVTAAKAKLATTATTVAGVAVRIDPNSRTSHTLVAVVDSNKVVVSITYGQDSAVADHLLATLSVTPNTTPLGAAGLASAHLAPPARALTSAAGVPFVGYLFDACSAPSVGAMQAWLSSPYRGVGIYIGGANRACGDGNLSASWVAQVTGMGWNLMPLYVGLQAPCANQGGMASIDGNSAYGQGQQGADDAANRAQGFGIGGGAPLINDMEVYASYCGGTVMAYLAGWNAQLHARGYASGVYTNVSPGMQQMAANPGSIPDMVDFADWDGVASTDGNGMPGLWTNHQRIKQYAGGHNEGWGGVGINIDSNFGDYYPAGSGPGFICCPLSWTKIQGNFDGNFDADVTVYRPGTGEWIVRGAPFGAVQWGWPGDIPVPGDYMGTGTAQMAVYRPSTGTWIIRGGPAIQWGWPGDIPVPGKYLGGNKMLPAIWRPSTGQWMIYGFPFGPIQWGWSGDIPVPGDYDGTGGTQMAVYRPSTGMWIQFGHGQVQWGWPGDIPVPADYYGNGVDQIAVYRPSTGMWIIHGFPYGPIQWGWPGDVPVPGDYMGRTSAQITVFRPSTGEWIILGMGSVQWGWPGDVPASATLNRLLLERYGKVA